MSGIKNVEKATSSVTHGRAIHESSTTKFCTVKIPAALAQAIDDYLREEDAAMRGFHSRADVVVGVLVDFMVSQGKLKPLVKPRMEHVNVYESHALVRDNLLNVTAEVRFQPPKAFCEYCVDHRCIHVEYALSLDEVRNLFGKLGLNVPRELRRDWGYVVVVDDVAYPLPTE